MLKFLKITASVIVAVILFVILGGVILTKVIDPNSYKAEAEKQLSNISGRKIHIVGNLELSYFPWIGVHISELIIENPRGVVGADFATIQDLQVKVRLLPLFTGNVDVNTISLNHAVFNLITDKSGNDNWANWGATDKVEQPASVEKKSTVMPIRDLSIANIEFHDSVINVIDQKTQQVLSVNNINFSVKSFSLQDFFPMQLAFELSKKGDPQKALVKFNAMTRVDLVSHHLTMPNLSLQAVIQRENMPTFPMTLTGHFDVDGQQQVVTLDPAVIQLPGIKINESIRVSQLSTVPVITIASNAKEGNLTTLTQALYNQDYLHGKLSFDSKLTARGNSSDALLKSSKGSGHLVVKEGTLEVIDLSRLVAQASAYINKKPLPTTQKKLLKTHFSLMTASYRINSGVVSNDDLMLNADNLAVTGAGAIDLISELINYKLLLTVSPDKNMPAANTLVLPINVTGKLDKPSVQPDWNRLAKQYFQGEIDNIIDTKDLGNTLKSLFN